MHIIKFIYVHMYMYHILGYGKRLNIHFKTLARLMQLNHDNIRRQPWVIWAHSFLNWQGFWAYGSTNQRVYLCTMGYSNHLAYQGNTSTQSCDIIWETQTSQSYDNNNKGDSNRQVIQTAASIITIFSIGPSGPPLSKLSYTIPIKAELNHL